MKTFFRFTALLIVCFLLIIPAETIFGSTTPNTSRNLSDLNSIHRDRPVPPELVADPNLIEDELHRGDVVEYVVNIANVSDEEVSFLIEHEVITEPEEDNVQRRVRNAQNSTPSPPYRDDPGDVIATYGIPFNSTFSLTWDYDNSLIWVLNYTDPGCIYALDPEDEEVVIQFNVPQGMYGLFYLDGVLYVGENERDDNFLHSYDTDGNELEPIRSPVNLRRTFVAGTSEFLLTHVRRTGRVNVFDFENLEQLGAIECQEFLNGDDVYDIVWVEDHPDGQLWMAGENFIYQFFVDDRWICEMVQQFGVPGNGEDYNGLTHDGENLWYGPYNLQNFLYEIEDGINENKWLNVEPEEGEIQPDGDMDIFVQVDATRLLEGDYEGAVYIRPDDEDVADLEIFVTFNITAAPVFRMYWEIGQEENVINWNQYYDEVYVGGEYVVPLTIINIGSEALEIQEITSDSEYFGADPDNLVIEPDDEQEVEITFFPDDMDLFEGTLTILCNDPGEEEFNINLRAEAFNPPEIFIDPLEFVEELLTGDSMELWFNIQNDGDAPLVWHSLVEILDEPELDRLVRNARSISEERPVGPNRDEPGEVLTQYGIPFQRIEGLAWDDDRSLIWGLNYNNPGSLFGLDPENGEIVDDFNIGDRNMGLFYRDRVFYSGRNLDNGFVINSFDMDGNLIDQFNAPIQGNDMFIAESELYLFINRYSSGAIQVFDFDNLGQVGEIRYNEINGAQDVGAIEWIDYHREGMLWFSNSNTIFQCSVDEEWNCELVQSFRSPGGGSELSGLAHDGNDLWFSRYGAMTIYMIDDGAVESRWLSIEPTFGEIQPEGDSDIFLRLDANHLMGGDYEGSIHILSNDVENPDTEVFVALQVNPASVFHARWDIGQDENQIDFNRYYDEVYTNGNYPVEVMIRNEGSAVLEIERVEIEEEAFTGQPEEFSVEIGEEAVFTVTFSPLEMGEYRSNLTIISNDPGNEECNIELIAEALDPPVIFVDPQEIEEFLFTGDVSEHWINIQNEGAAVLNWNSQIEIFIEPERDRFNRNISSINELLQSDNQDNVRAPLRDDPGEVLQTFNLPHANSMGLAWDSDNSFLWVVNFNDPARLYSFDTEEGNVVNQFNVIENIYGLFYLDGVIFCGGNGRNEQMIHRYDIEGNELEPWQSPINLNRTYVGGSEELFMTHARRSVTINVFDIDDLEQVGSIEFERFIEGEQTYAFVWVESHPDGQLWVAGDRNIYQFFVDEDWNCELVQQFRVPNQGDDYNGITHDGVNLLYAPYQRGTLHLIDDGTEELNWITFEPRSGQINPDFDMDTFVWLNAEGLIGGLYEAFIHIFSNDPVNPEVEVHIALEVEGAPDIELEWEFGMEDNRIDWNRYFAEVYVFGEYEVPVTISNPGTDDLEIEMIEFENEVFTVQPEELLIAAHQQDVITITFSPQEMAEFRTDMIITSNDPGEEETRVELIAESFDPPVIVVDPLELNEFLFTGESSEHQINIRNDGAAPLRWNSGLEIIEPEQDQIIRSVRNISTSQVVEAKAPYRDDPGDILATYNVPHGRTEGLAWDFDRSWIWGLNYDNPGQLYALNPEEGEIRREIRLPDEHMGLFYRDGILYVGGDTRNNMILRYDTEGDELQPLLAPIRMENVFIAENEDFLFTNSRRSGEIRVFTFDDLDQVGIINYRDVLNTPRIYSIEWIDEHTEGKLWLAGEELIYQCFVDEDWNCELVQSFPRPGQGQQYSGMAHDGENLWFGYREDWVWYVIDDGVAEFAWISFEPRSGEINPDSDMDIIVTLNAEDLIAGMYEANIHIFSNDPERPEVEVTVTLEVEGAPNISLEWEFGMDANIINWNEYFDEVYVNGRYVVPLTIRNSGTDVLEVVDIDIDNEAFSNGQWRIEVEAREEIVVDLTFAPDENREYAGELTILSNDPNNDQVSVELIAAAFEPPDIEVDPMEIDRFMLSGIEVNIPLILSNVGEAPLNWSAELEFIEEFGQDGSSRQVRSINPNEPELPERDDPWATIQVDEGSLRNGMEVDLQLEINTGGMFTGQYEAFVNIVSNDPDEPEVRVNIILDVLGVPEIDVEWEIGMDVNTISWNEYFDEVYVNGRYEIPLTIRNSGTDVLEIEDITIDNEAFTTGEWMVEIGAREEIEVNLVFTPDENIWYVGELTIISNDPNNDQVTVELVAVAFEPPDIEVNPMEIDRFMLSGIRVDIPLILSNVGEAPLSWSAELEFIEEVGQDGSSRQVRSINPNEPEPPERDDPWATIQVDEGSLPNGMEIDLQLEINAEGMFSGQYEAFVNIASNDPDEPEVRVHIILEVLGVPEIEVEWEIGMEDNLVDWNEYLSEVFMTGTYAVPLTIHNRGTHELTVENITFTNEAFHVEDVNFVVPHSESAVIDLLFSPENPEVYQGEMTIFNDDNDEPEVSINLTGRGFTPPVIEVDPVEIEGDVRTGERIERAFSIANTGEAQLRWRAATELVEEEEFADMGPVRDSPGDSIRTYRIPYDGNSGLAWDGELIWGVTQTNHRMYSLNPETERIAHVHRIHDRPIGIAIIDGQYWIGQGGRDIFIYDRDGDLLGEMNLRDNSGITSDQNARIFLNDGDDDVWVYHIEDMEIDRISYENIVGGDEIGSIYWAEECRFGQLWLMAEEMVYQVFVDEDWNAILYQQFEWDADGNNAGLAHDGADIWHGMRDERFWYRNDDGIEQVNWIRLDLYVGELSENQEVDIVVILDAQELFGGVHEANIHILSNDPDDGDVVISVTLDVSGDPEIETEPIAHPNEGAEVFECGTAFVDEPVFNSFIISNPGTSDLIIEGIESTNPEFRLNLDVDSVIKPQTSVETDVLFRPSNHGLCEGVINIYTNAINIGQGDEQGHIWYTVEGTGVRHPEITSSPGDEELLTVLYPVVDETIHRNLTISNSGDEGAIPLRFIISSDEVDVENNDEINTRMPDPEPGYHSDRNDEGPQRDDPGDVIFNYNGDYRGIGGLAWAEGQMWGVSYTHEVVFAFDPESRDVTFTCASTEAPTGMTFDGTHLWIGQRISQWIYLYDLEGNVIERVAMNFGSIGGIATDQRNFIFVNSREDSLIHVLSIATREEITTFEFQAAMGNRNIWSIEWVPEHPEGQLWGLTQHRMFQAQIDDLWNAQPVQDFRCGAYHRFNGIAHDGVNMWHGNWMNSRLHVVDDGNEEISMISWLNIEPSHGWIDQGDSLDVTIAILPALLEEGVEYAGEIVIQSNDPENEEVVIDISITSEMSPRYFDSFEATEQIHHLSLRNVRFENELVATGCEIGVITPDGILAGAAVWDSDPEVDIWLEAFGDNPGTEEVEGFVAGEGFLFRAWDYVTDTEWEFVYAEFTEGQQTWQNGGESMVSIQCSDEFSTPSESILPESYFLSNAYPNPFNSVTNIEFGLPVTGHMSLGIYDIRGREVISLINQTKPAGQYTTSWNGAGATSGVYLIVMETGFFKAVRKVMLVR